MQLVIVSHKTCWRSPNSNSGFATDGGFPLQVRAISELFTKTSLVVPCESDRQPDGLTPLTGQRIQIVPLAPLRGRGVYRKLAFLGDLFKSGPVIWKQVRNADAVHALIPGDIGTIGMIFSLIQRKRLFVRYCGNWAVQTTAAERFWRWSIERFAGGRNVMLATGGGEERPSRRNRNVEWIFSTSLRRDEIDKNVPRYLPPNQAIKLIVVCRQEQRKGTDLVIESMPLILRFIPNATLDIVGSGSLLECLKAQVIALGVSDCITFHGKVSQADVGRLLRQATIFCFPTAASEGFPKAVLEALGSGLPVVTTKVSVLPQLIGGRCGIILETRSPGAIAEAVKLVCSDPAKYNEMSSAAIKVAERYSLENWRDQIGAVLRKAWQTNSLSPSMNITMRDQKRPL